MSATLPKAIRIGDYRPPAWRVDTVDLAIELDPATTRVRSRLEVRRNPDSTDGGPLVLDGQDIELVSVAVDGHVLGADRYTLDAERLTIDGLPDRCLVAIENTLSPAANTALEGLYVSGGLLCTQCEAEGFRRITFYPDRPDVLAVFTVTLTADRERYPVLLANGNLVAEGALDSGRHYARWHDPFPKPCYLFALVAGDLVCSEGHHRTPSGRDVVLRVYVEAHNADQCAHALASLGRAMRWDEKVFGREYDLDLYMIVAVDDFNMGAMENKGLNLFNAKYVLARPDMATDDDFVAIQGVIAHEYFHNWTGNRITCRDWFQLSLKEGLTVYRDQRFTEEETLGPVKRIEDVRHLRAMQFPEDAGPLAHPVRPQSYIEINNFYTMTVYEKGAEVVRMIATLLGPEGFRRGMDLYFARHDGSAATIEDFVACMSEAGGRDFTRFMLWYDQAGTPRVEVEDDYDPVTHRYVLRFRQSCPATPGQAEKRPFHIPVAVGLLDRDGHDLPLRMPGETGAGPATRVLELTEHEQTFIFMDVPVQPVPSLLRGFSAPVRIEYAYDDDALAFLMAHDSDGFNRWEAGRRLVMKVLLAAVAAVQEGRQPELPPILGSAARRLVEEETIEPMLVAETLSLPAEEEIGEALDTVDVDAVSVARHAVRQGMALALAKSLRERYDALAPQGGYRFDRQSMGRRRLRNLCLALLVATGDPDACRLAAGQYRVADNMTDAMGALEALRDAACPEREAVMADFAARWRNAPLVLDKWFALGATSRLPGALERVEALMRHPGFSLRNPNRVRAVIGAFTRNPPHFHAADGAGYGFIAERILDLDAINPQVAARLATAFTRWRRYDAARQTLMRHELERILRKEGLSRDVREIVTKSLD